MLQISSNVFFLEKIANFERSHIVYIYVCVFVYYISIIYNIYNIIYMEESKFLE